MEETDQPLNLYYEIGYRTYEAGANVVTFDLRRSAEWAGVQTRVAGMLTDPGPASAQEGSAYRITFNSQP